MNLEVIHTDRGNIADAYPMRALIERREHSEVRSRVEQFWIDRILADYFNRIALRKIACDRLPCFAQISRSQYQGAVITRAIRIDRDVRYVRIDIGRFNTH